MTGWRWRLWVLLLVGVAHIAGAANPGGHGAATGEHTAPVEEDGECSREVHRWFQFHYEYFHLENWVLAALVVITMVFEYGWHALSHRISHEGMQHAAAAHAEHQQHNPQDEQLATKESKRAISEDFQEEFRVENRSLYATLTERCAGELMVLGFLAWVVWSCARSGAFHKLACELLVSHINLPEDAHGYVETIEDVHMHLFLTMVAFIAILAVGIFLSGLQIKHGQKMDKAILEAVHNREEAAALQDFCPEGVNVKDFVFFFKSRRLLFCRITYELKNRDKAAGRYAQGLDLLIEVLEDIQEHKMPGTHFKVEDVPSLLDEWFCFSSYAKLMCHYLMVDLVEIKMGTWLYVCIGLIVSASLLLATHDLVVHFLVVGVQLAVALALGLAIPIYLMKQRSEELVPGRHQGLERTPTKSSSTGSSEHDVTKQEPVVHIPEVSLPGSLRIEDFPMFSLQMFIFFWCYNLVRIVAANFWWYTNTEFAIVALVLLSVTIPAVGYLVSRILSSMGAMLSRGDVRLQKHHVTWLYCIASAHLTKIRRESRRESRRLKRAAEKSAEREGEDQAHL